MPSPHHHESAAAACDLNNLGMASASVQAPRWRRGMSTPSRPVKREKARPLKAAGRVIGKQAQGGPEYRQAGFLPGAVFNVTLRYMILIYINAHMLRSQQQQDRRDSLWMSQSGIQIASRAVTGGGLRRSIVNISSP